MNQSNARSKTGKVDERRQEPEEKRGFFAAAGQRLKRALSGAPAVHEAPAAAAAQPDEGDLHGEAAETETSVQARARELVRQDRAHGPGRSSASAAAPHEPGKSTSVPPPLPSLRASAESPSQPHGPSQPPPLPKSVRAPRKRPARDSKTAQLRARLGAAKAQLAEAQAKRGPELPEQATSIAAEAAVAESPTPGDEPATQAEADVAQPAPAEAPTADGEPALQAHADAAQPAPAEAPTADGEPALHAEAIAAQADAAADPIRTLTIARLLAGQGYFERSLRIYDELLATSTDDSELQAEADAVRAQQLASHPSSGDSAS